MSYRYLFLLLSFISCDSVDSPTAIAIPVIPVEIPIVSPVVIVPTVTPEPEFVPPPTTTTVPTPTPEPEPNLESMPVPIPEPVPLVCDDLEITSVNVIESVINSTVSVCFAAQGGEIVGMLVLKAFNDLNSFIVSSHTFINNTCNIEEKCISYTTIDPNEFCSNGAQYFAVLRIIAPVDNIGEIRKQICN